MFKEKPYKKYLITLAQLILFALILFGNFTEFISHFLITDEFTFLELPLPMASLIEFIIFTVFSLGLALLSVILMKWEKLFIGLEYAVCITFILINVLKLIFYIPSINLDKPYIFYTIKQFIPLITNGITILIGTVQIPELKYEKYSR